MIGKNERTRSKQQSENAEVALLQLRADRSLDSVDRADDYYSRRLGY